MKRPRSTAPAWPTGRTVDLPGAPRSARGLAPPSQRQPRRQHGQVERPGDLRVNSLRPSSSRSVPFRESFPSGADSRRSLMLRARPSNATGSRRFGDAGLSLPDPYAEPLRDPKRSADGTVPAVFKTEAEGAGVGRKLRRFHHRPRAAGSKSADDRCKPRRSPPHRRPAPREAGSTRARPAAEGQDWSRSSISSNDSSPIRCRPPEIDHECAGLEEWRILMSGCGDP